jgi:hypothetical protein
MKRIFRTKRKEAGVRAWGKLQNVELDNFPFAEYYHVDK